MYNAHTNAIPEGGKARRVYLLLLDEIARGTFRNGSILPGEQQLAKTHGVSRVTIRRALSALADDGLIERKAGCGTIVRSQFDQAAPLMADIASLMPQLLEMGRKSTAKLLSLSYGTPPEAVAKDMQLAPDAQVQIATRLRLVSDTPFSHLTTYVPELVARNFDGKDLATTPLLELLERSGVQIKGARQSVSATLASPATASALCISFGSPLLSINRVMTDMSGRCVEYLSALYRPDLFQLDMELSRVNGQGAWHWEPRMGPNSKRDST